MLKRQKWRYSYGRQCYKNKFAQSKISLPTKHENIDEELIKGIVENTSYWNYIQTFLPGTA